MSARVTTGRAITHTPTSQSTVAARRRQTRLMWPQPPTDSRLWRLRKPPSQPAASSGLTAVASTVRAAAEQRRLASTRNQLDFTKKHMLTLANGIVRVFSSTVACSAKLACFVKKENRVGI